MNLDVILGPLKWFGGKAGTRKLFYEGEFHIIAFYRL